jgi:hypothetical protein
MAALAKGALLVKNIKNVIIDGDALFKTNKGFAKVVLDALRKLGDTSSITVLTTDEATMKKAVSDAFTVEQETDVPYYEEITKSDNTKTKIRKYRKEMAKIQLIQPIFHEIGQKDDPIGDFLRWVDLQQNSASRDLWVITSNPKIVKRYYHIADIVMQPNDAPNQSGSKFRMIYVKDANGWKEVIADDSKDVVEAKEKAVKKVPDEVDDETEKEAEKEAEEEELPDKIEGEAGAKPKKNAKYQ